MAKTDPTPKPISTFTHTEQTRKNIPTAEYQAMVESDTKTPIRVAYDRRNRDLDPQLVWRGKDEQDWSDLVVNAPPLYIQEKVHPKVLIDDLVKQTQKGQKPEDQFDLFADFNGLPSEGAKTEFYQHDAHWTNRMILGDSLQVMASLAEREGLRGKVQCIYFDPPYGIKFNSNFQWSTTSRDVKDGNLEHITREPEQVKAFRDTWRDGIHSYLTYLRDRLTVARDLLTDSGSIFVQIGEENVHRVRCLLEEVFGDENYVSQIGYHATSGSTSEFLSNPKNYVLWFAKDHQNTKYRPLFIERPFDVSDPGPWQIVEVDTARTRLTDYLSSGQKLESPGVRIARLGDATSQRQGREAGDASAMGFPFIFRGDTYRPAGTRGWSTTEPGMVRAARATRLHGGGRSLSLVRYFDESPYFPLTSSWEDTGGTIGADKVYVVQTNVRVIQRCMLLASDPGDLVLDPTCGSGTTAYVAEQWGRRWITIDTSRVALALARARIMGARYPYYLMADSPEGQAKESEVTRTPLSSKPTYRNLKHGFVYERVPHITLKSIANNAEIDVIWDKWQAILEPLRAQLNQSLGKNWEEWEIPRDVAPEWWKARIARQKEIDASIAAKAEYEYLYDKPYEDKKKVRVAGPFTVESLSPHRTFAVDENDELIDELKEPAPGFDVHDFAGLILDNLLKAGVQQPDKADKITFTSLTPWPGRLICAEGRYDDKRAAIFLGPEFGTVSRPDLVEAAREAAEANFDVLIACAFNYDAHSTEFHKLGRIPVLKARMNADLHMAEDLRNNGQGNLFVIFGEPDIEVQEAGNNQVTIEVKGVDVFDPRSGDVRSDGPDGIACWFIDTDYNEESFFVRHAYFLGANDPYGSLKTTLKAEINADAWATLNSAVSRPFEKPKNGRIAVKVINHLGDEVMKVFRV
ncbi:MAG: site-specific DNA-methyltransferase [Spirochaetales bacterium]